MPHDPLNIRLQGQAGRLAAHLYLPLGEPPFSAVVLCHGITSCKENYADLAVFLHGEGFAVLSYDCRGHGQSEGGLDGAAWQDVITALDYLQGRKEVDARRLAVVGSSMGAHNGLRAAAETTGVQTVVALNTAPSEVLLQGLLDVHYWHWIQLAGGRVRVALPDLLLYLESENIYDLPKRIQPRPIFLIHARDDEFVPYTVGEKLRAGASEGSRLWLLDQGGHSGPRRDPVVQQAIAEWLRDKLR
jgi:pimeloyl-ACP methyl ester carboxylesterase